MQYKIRKFLEDKFGGRIRLVTSSRSWSAIARGAAIRGLQLETPPIAFRHSRDSIGVVIMEPFDSLHHLDTDRYNCPERGELAKNQMYWLIDRGEKLRASTRKTLQCQTVIEHPEKKGPHVAFQEICRCKLDEKDRPSRKDDIGKCRTANEIS